MAVQEAVLPVAVAAEEAVAVLPVAVAVLPVAVAVTASKRPFYIDMIDKPVCCYEMTNGFLNDPR